ncbi:Hsp70 family protein [Glycomyces arizonensis]|uniref:Hsp70 family protein n=1 Tax=Glycomyces arizonensis TaxID=256035 RepID=UPI0006864D70|nr:Hsp70 family protein [Glycomyces arizonensis]
MSNFHPRSASISVDFGTSHTVVTVRRADGRVRQQLFDGSPQLPSAVFLSGAGLVVGADAARGGRRNPERCEPHPKRRIDDGAILLGETELPVTSVITAVLARVVRECGQIPSGLGPVAVTVPATWEPARSRVMADAAAAAGLGGVSLVAEPVAAASYFAEVLDRDVPMGSGVVVYDLGGTLGATVLRRTPAAFEVLAAEGADDLGGLALDRALAEHLSRCFRPEDPRWSRLMTPRNDADRRHRVSFLDEARGAKERLSGVTATSLALPLFDTYAHLTRDELETVAAPLIERTVRITQDAIREAGLAPEQIAGLFPVGAASRMPLVATMLRHGLGIEPAAVERPELAVSEGGLVAQAVVSSPAAPAGTPNPPPRMPHGAGPVRPSDRASRPAGPRTRSAARWPRTKRALIAPLAVVLAAALATVLVAVNLPGDDRSDPEGSAAGSDPTGGPVEDPSTSDNDEDADLLQHALNGGTVRIGYFEEYPYTYTDENGNVTGYSVDVYLYLLTQLGVEEDQVEWVHRDWGHLLSGLGTTHDFIVSGVAIEPERCSMVAFGNLDLLTPDSLLVLAGNPLGLSDTASIADHDSAVVGVVDGSTEQDVATGLGIPDDRVVVRDTLEELVLELRAGGVDAIAYGRNYLEDKAWGEEDIEVGEPFLPKDPDTGEEIVRAGGTAFLPADAAFRDALDDELAALKGDRDRWEALAGEYGFTVEENFPPEDLTAESLCEGEYR